MFRRLFKGGSGEPEDIEEPIEDLIVLERYEEAEGRLKLRLQENSKDLHSHLKLAEVYGYLRRPDDAAETYVHVAAEYAGDGFFDKAIALLARAQKLQPTNEELPRKIYAYEQAKQLDRKRSAAIDGARGDGSSGVTSTQVLDLQRLWFKLAAGGLIPVLPADQVRRLFSVLRFDKPATGSVLVERGQVLPELYLIAGAEVDAVMEKGGVEKSMRTFTTRDILGDSALLEQTPWPATYRVTKGGLILTLDRAGLEAVLVGNPDPRQLLSALRAQGNDGEIDDFVRRLES